MRGTTVNDQEDRACRADDQQLRYRASHLYNARLVTLNVRATTSGLSPACTLRTARMRSASRVA